MTQVCMGQLGQSMNLGLTITRVTIHGMILQVGFQTHIELCWTMIHFCSVTWGFLHHISIKSSKNLPTIFCIFFGGGRVVAPPSGNEQFPQKTWRFPVTKRRRKSACLAPGAAPKRRHARMAVPWQRGTVWSQVLGWFISMEIYGWDGFEDMLSLWSIEHG